LLFKQHCNHIVIGSIKIVSSGNEPHISASFGRALPLVMMPLIALVNLAFYFRKKYYSAKKPFPANLF
jgi:hypothetical protein